MLRSNRCFSWKREVPHLGEILLMPLSDIYGFVIVSTQNFSDGCFVVRDKSARLNDQKFVTAALGASCSSNLAQIDSSWVFTCENTYHWGRTNGTGWISIGEIGSLFGNSVKAMRLVKSTTIYTDIRPTEIMNEKKNYIGFWFFIYTNVDAGENYVSKSRKPCRLLKLSAFFGKFSPLSTAVHF